MRRRALLPLVLAAIAATDIALTAAPALGVTFTVTTTADSGSTSVREAITSANADSTQDSRR